MNPVAFRSFTQLLVMDLLKPRTVRLNMPVSTTHLVSFVYLCLCVTRCGCFVVVVEKSEKKFKFQNVVLMVVAVCFVLVTLLAMLRANCACSGGSDDT